MSKVLNLLAWTALAAGLIGSTILPEITNIATLSLKGLTNAMFGVLSQTVLYAVILALIAVLSVPGGNRNSA